MKDGYSDRRQYTGHERQSRPCTRCRKRNRPLDGAPSISSKRNGQVVRGPAETGNQLYLSMTSTVWALADNGTNTIELRRTTAIPKVSAPLRIGNCSTSGTTTALSTRPFSRWAFQLEVHPARKTARPASAPRPSICPGAWSMWERNMTRFIHFELPFSDCAQPEIAPTSTAQKTFPVLLVKSS